jgi:lysine-N-methylase
MPFPIKHLPVLQNWDCHVTGSCCKEYYIPVSDEERQRIEAQNWDSTDLGGLSPFTRHGPPWARRYRLNHRSDGSCVFLSEEGRCRIHERFGYDAKPLPCRLFPFVLVPVGDHWRVSLRYACPSAAANKGRALPEHDKDLLVFAAQLANREGRELKPDGSLNSPPRFDGPGQRLDWSDTLRIVNALVQMLRNRRDPVERRLRKCLHFVTQMRQARLEQIRGSRLEDLIDILQRAADAETPANPMQVPAPGWIGRVLFRQAVALFTRKDRGPNRGMALRGRLARLGAAWRFARGRGSVPRIHGGLPESTFEEIEVPRGPLPPEADEILERYYIIKVGSLQFCGSASFGLPFWEGFEVLALTFPLMLWVARMYRDCSREQAITRALTVVDDHVGFNRVLATFRQRLSFQILSRRGELARLIAWYGR